MKRRLPMYFFLLLFLLMLLFPKLIFFGASTGLMLWFETVLPTLLPFIIICNLLIKTSSFTVLSRLAAPLLGRIFRVSGQGCFAVLTGFLCGYPMGAKVTADLLKNGHISQREAQYLLSFCNNTSPAFILSYLVMHNLKKEALALPVLLILVLSPIICSFLFRRYYHIPPANFHTSAAVYTPCSARMMDESIMNGFETITKVGGYMMLFSILLTLAGQLPFQHPAFSLILLPSFEITNGIHMICSVSEHCSASFVGVLALTSFGGFCSIAQTQGMLADTGLSVVPYIVEKLITALVTSLIAYLFLLL